MAHEKFTVEVLTPEGEVFNDEVEMVSTRTTVGSIGILAHHQPLLGMLDPTELRLYKTDRDVVRSPQAEAFAQVSRDRVLLLVEEAVPADQIDTSEQREKLKRAEEEMSSADQGSEQWKTAERDKRRAEAFLRMAEGE